MRTELCPGLCGAHASLLSFLASHLSVCLSPFPFSPHAHHCSMPFFVTLPCRLPVSTALSCMFDLPQAVSLCHSTAQEWDWLPAVTGSLTCPCLFFLLPSASQCVYLFNKYLPFCTEGSCIIKRSCGLPRRRFCSLTEDPKWVLYVSVYSVFITYRASVWPQTKHKSSIIQGTVR